ncbi:hypothetical protein E2I00_016234, partial [Balaenoptera physalus]
DLDRLQKQKDDVRKLLQTRNEVAFSVHAGTTYLAPLPWKFRGAPAPPKNLPVVLVGMPICLFNVYAADPSRACCLALLLLREAVLRALQDQCKGPVVLQVDSSPSWWPEEQRKDGVRWSGDVGKQQSHQSGAGVRLHPAVKRRGLSLQRKERRQGLEAPRQAVQPTTAPSVISGLAHGHPARQGTRAGPWQQTWGLSQGQELLAEAGPAAPSEAHPSPFGLSRYQHSAAGRGRPAVWQASGVTTSGMADQSRGREKLDEGHGCGRQATPRLGLVRVVLPSLATEKRPPGLELGLSEPVLPFAASITPEFMVFVIQPAFRPPVGFGAVDLAGMEYLLCARTWNLKGNIEPEVALPPEKTDGLASGDEKKMEKTGESCPGSKKQLKFEVVAGHSILDSLELPSDREAGRLRWEEVLIRPEVDAVDAHAHSIRGPPPSLPLTVAPDGSQSKKSILLNHPDLQNTRPRAETKPAEELRSWEKKQRALLRFQGDSRLEQSGCYHHCVDENIERRNHYLDLAGIENYTSQFGPVAQKSELPPRTSNPARSRSHEPEAIHVPHRKPPGVDPGSFHFLDAPFAKVSEVQQRLRGGTQDGSKHFVRSPKAQGKSVGVGHVARGARSKPPMGPAVPAAPLAVGGTVVGRDHVRELPAVVVYESQAGQ